MSLRPQGRAVGCALLALGLAGPARALTIIPDFSSSITGASNAAAIEGAIDSAASTIGSLFSNPFSVTILFEAVHDGSNGFLAASESSYYTDSYSGFTSLLKSDAAANPANTILNSAVANLSSGNKGGTDGIIATNTVFEALGLSLPGAYNTAGAYVGSGTVDGVVLLNLDQPLSFTEPLPAYNGRNLEYDATRAVEHEIDEVLGGGGSGSTLNDIAYYGKNNRADPFTYYEGALDLYRYSAQGKASFSTSPALSYLSVNGGKTSVVGFNQYAQGDLADFGPTAYACSGGGIGGPPGLIQDAFSCPNQTGEAFTTSSPEYLMLEALGYDPTGGSSKSGGVGAAVKGAMATVFGVQDPEGFDPINGAQMVPEPATWVMTLTGFAAMAAAFRWAPRRRAARAG